MKIKLLLSLLLAAPVVAAAGVNPKNGNFYITYTDVSLKSNAHELEITRTYNSKSSEVGWFGFGWGSRYETRLIVLPDGSAAVKEIGSGRTNYYRSKDGNAVKTGIRRIVEAATRQENLSTSAAEQLAVQLLGDEELRLSKVIKYGLHAELPQGRALGDYCGETALSRVAEGYRRIDCNRFGDSEPAIDTFDLKGRLIRHELQDGYAVTVEYADAGTAEIRDTLGQRIALSWTPEGRVARAKTAQTEVNYFYTQPDLTEVSTRDGNTYRYYYDNNHNLTRINYIDDSNMFISYSPRVNGMADAVTQRNGDQQTFVYRTDPGNSRHYWTRHTVISRTGQTVSREYEYEDQVSALGTPESSRIAQTTPGGSAETKFDSQGRVIRKANDSGGFAEYTYHPVNNKLIQVLNNGLKTEFRYDEQGNLTRAENSDGQVIDLEYAKTPLIQRIIEVNRAERTRRELTFNYNQAGRPLEITLVGTGTITVEYDDQGEISKVDSPQGEKMALQITQAFQNVLRVVSVAGAKL